MTVRARRWSGDWALPAPRGEPQLDVLIPTTERGAELAVTLAGLAAQDGPEFDVVISDQSETEPSWSHPVAEAMLRVLDAQGRASRLLRNLPRRGLAEQRRFLFDQSTAPYVLFLDDDVWLEPGSLERAYAAIRDLRCGFVGFAPQGLSFLDDDRPQERVSFEPWPDGVTPERVRHGSESHRRWPLHNAANLAHLAAEWSLPEGTWLAYRIAWVGGCVLYDRQALRECGGFDFWDRLPDVHSGEDVAAQWRVMERFGGAGLLPSGAVHLEAATTVPVRDVDAADVLFGGQQARTERTP